MNSTTPTPSFARAFSRRALFLAASALALIYPDCRPRDARQSVTELSAFPSAKRPSTVAERAELFTKQLRTNGKLPGVLLDAQIVQEEAGDGVFGPADYSTFYALTVPVADLPAWRAELADSPVLNIPAKYAAPKAWWLTPAEFEQLVLFGAKPLTGRVNGWVGFATDGRIFITA